MQTSDHKSPAGMFFVAYSGPSMNPTLCAPELLEVVPYESRPLRVGDVAYFLSPDVDQPVVHRIVRITPAGISTLGDNNSRIDPSLLQPDCMKGRVVAAWRDRKRRTIAGGLAGRVTGHWRRWQRILTCVMTTLLSPLYQSLSQRGLIARMMPHRFLPRVVTFQSGGQEWFRLLLGRRIIGTYDVLAGQWRIQRPFKLIVNKGSLPECQLHDRSKQHAQMKDGRP
jgi:hypothetical protein